MLHLNNTKEFLKISGSLHLSLSSSVCTSNEDLKEPVDESLSQVDPDIKGAIDDLESLVDKYFLAFYKLSLRFSLASRSYFLNWA